MWYKKLHWKIIIGLVLGLIYGAMAAQFGWIEFTKDWINPWGTIFINLLKFIAVPLVLTSLITGVASLSDVKKLSKMGGKTISIYIGTTAIAVTIGLVVANIFNPGNGIPNDLKEKLQTSYQKDIAARQGQAQSVKERRPLTPLVEMVPSNIFKALSNNKNMLQVVFIAIIFGIALIQLKQEDSDKIVSLLQIFNDAVLRTVDLVMIMAPVGVFSLMAKTIVSVSGSGNGSIIELMRALGVYMLVVCIGLLIHTLITYPSLLKIFTKMKYKNFIKGIAPAQLLAFSTSSSGATLPVTMERCEENLGVSEEVSSFVLPLGATINMDGTALYQAVAAVFIAQATGMDLSLGQQVTIVFTAVLASIGTAAVPGAGIIMLVIILEAIGVPSAGIALILGVDRLLDMLRTVTNVTGDATVAVTIASIEGHLETPLLKEDEEHHLKSKRD
jgi:proton glutamate symport protein